MRFTRVTTFINHYKFELAIILAEMLVCLIVTLTVLTLVAPPLSWAMTEPQLKQPQRFTLVTLPPPGSRLPEPVEESEIYITVTELQVPSTTPTPTLTLATSSQDTFTQPELSDASPLLSWPVSGQLSQGFGCSPFYTGISRSNCPASQPWFHDGLDIAAWPGAPVRAGLTGTVTFAGPDGDGPLCGAYRGFGLGVVVDTGSGWQALYAHLDDITVSVGQQVAAETLIGTVGQTGCVSGPHLHFGLRRDGRLVDPALFRP